MSSEPARRPAPVPDRPVPLRPVPTEAERRAFDGWLAEWIAEAAHRRLQRARDGG